MIQNPQSQPDMSYLENADFYFKECADDPEFKKAFKDESLKITLAQAVHKKRKKLKWSQANLAKQAKTTQRMISRIERADMSVGVDLLQRVAHALGAKITITLA